MFQKWRMNLFHIVLEDRPGYMRGNEGNRLYFKIKKIISKKVELLNFKKYFVFVAGSM